MSRKKKILIGLGVVLLLLQFFRIDKTNPKHVAAQDFIQTTNPPDAIAGMIKNSCYDCHSHQTTYPWYSNIAPFSFMLRSHVKGGRQFLNFSTWDTYDPKKKDHKLQEMIEVLEDHRMPMKSYAFMHGQAKLSDQNRLDLISWIKSKT